MIPYIIAFTFPVLMAMLQPIHKPSKSLRIWIPTAIMLIIFVGFRDEVGSDWFNYMAIYTRDMPGMDYMDALRHDDPLFYLLMTWVYKMGWSIHVVNFVSSIFFVTGLVIFSRRMPNPWLALTAAMGYTVLTSGMGYVRMGVAFGFALWAIIELIDKKFIKFFILIIIGTAFHKSAILMLGFGLFYGGKGKYFKGLATLLMGVGVYVAFVSGNEAHYSELYLSNKLHSSGAYIRSFMNVIPAIIFLYFRKRWKRLWPKGYVLWFLMALAALAAIPMVAMFSTATDRISMYLIPLQFVVFSHLPLLLEGKMSPKLTAGLVITYYALVYFVWLNFADYAYAWVPYQNILPTWLGMIF